MTIKRLIDFIRYEARLPGSSTATALISELILQILREYTAIDLYQQNLVIDNTITITANRQLLVALPADFQHLKVDRVRYLPAGSEDQLYFLLETEYFDGPNSNQPNRYQLQDTSITLFPNDGVLIGDKVRFDYYFATTAFADTDLFPIPILEGVVWKACVARLLRTFGKDGNVSDGDAERSLARSKGDGTTNK